jgi:hypothetical protein
MQRFRATGYPSWNQKRYHVWKNLVRGSYSGDREQKFPTQIPKSQNFPKFHQQLSGIIMHTFGIQQ